MNALPIHEIENSDADERTQNKSKTSENQAHPLRAELGASPGAAQDRFDCRGIRDLRPAACILSIGQGRLVRILFAGRQFIVAHGRLDSQGFSMVLLPFTLQQYLKKQARDAIGLGSGRLAAPQILDALTSQFLDAGTVKVNHQVAILVDQLDVDK